MVLVWRIFTAERAATQGHQMLLPNRPSRVLKIVDSEQSPCKIALPSLGIGDHGRSLSRRPDPLADPPRTRGPQPAELRGRLAFAWRTEGEPGRCTPATPTTKTGCPAAMITPVFYAVLRLAARFLRTSSMSSAMA